MSAAAHVVRHVTCLGCGCACDDIDLVVQGGRIVDARAACHLGVDWFGDGHVPARVLAGGRDSSMDAALDAAARCLVSAARPLVYLAPDVSCEAQREAVAVADLLRAGLDSVTSATSMAMLLAAQERGRAGATLGEIRNRADLVVWWGVDPGVRYPRYASRYAPDPAGVHVPAGRRSRTVIAVDVAGSRGPEDADRRLAVAPGDEVATLTALAGAVTGPNVRGGGVHLGSADVWQHVRELGPVLHDARYAVIVADAEPDSTAPERDPRRADALVALAQALNGPTRCALSLLRAGGNRSGADAVMTWQTGYPVTVDFARGAPRYRPYDGTAGARLASGEADAVLVIGAPALVPPDVRSKLTGVTVAVVGPRASESPFAGGVAAIDTGVAGIHEGGTALRMDDVPLPLRGAIEGPPATATIARALCERIVTVRRNA